MSEHPRIAIVGAGLIGCAWAVSFARGGCSVRLFDRSADVAGAAPASIAAIAGELEAADLLGETDAASMMRNIDIAATLPEALDGAIHVQENTPERLDVKKAVFAELDAIADPAATLASSTSALLPSAFTEDLPGRARCLVAHPINPPSLIPAVEVVPAPWTAPGTMSDCMALMRRIGQRPIRMKREIDGFIMNRLQSALLHEAFRLVADGVVEPEDVDIGIAHGLAPRWALMGPFETIDLNAPGGVRDYVERYGDMYRRIGAEQKRLVDWEGDTLDRIDTARRAELPVTRINQAQARRDSRLIALMKHLRDDAQRQTS